MFRESGVASFLYDLVDDQEIQPADEQIAVPMNLVLTALANGSPPLFGVGSYSIEDFLDNARPSIFDPLTPLEEAQVCALAEFLHIPNGVMELSGCILTSVEIVDDDPALPQSFSVSQNWPNPFNGDTRVSVSLPESGNIVFDVYNLLGQKVDTRSFTDLTPGIYDMAITFENRASGIYFLKVIYGSTHETIKMNYVK